MDAAINTTTQEVSKQISHVRDEIHRGSPQSRREYGVCPERAPTPRSISLGDEWTLGNQRK